MIDTIFRNKACPKCGTDQWLISSEYYDEPDFPKLPLGRGRKTALAKRNKMSKAIIARRHELEKNSICQFCYMKGSDFNVQDELSSFV